MRRWPNPADYVCLNPVSRKRRSEALARAEAKKFLDDSLALVESEAIRKWARSRKNYPIWRKMALQAMNTSTPDRFATYIVGCAIGLWQ